MKLEPGIRYSRGENKFDAHPVQKIAPGFDAFADRVLADQAPAKGRQYVCAPCRSNGDDRPHRGATDVLPRAWHPFDIDRIDPATLLELVQWFHSFRGFAYTTASHTADAPRLRAILSLSREVSRDEGIRLGEALQAQALVALGGVDIGFDKSVYRGEQPCFCPPAGAQVYRFKGEPVAVDSVLGWWAKQQPAEQPREHKQPAWDEAEQLVAKLGRKLRSGDGRRDLLTRYIASGSARHLSEAELWALVRSFAADYFDPADPIDDDNIQKIIAWARRKDAGKAQAPPSSDDAVLGVDAGEFIAAFQPTDYAIASILPRDSVHALTAVTNHGKTAVALTITMESVLEHGSRGLILCGENVNAFRARLLATVERLGGSRDQLGGKVRVIPKALALNNYLSEIIAEGNALGRCDWVLVDTSAAYFSYEKEDDNVMALHHARDLRELTTIAGHPGVLVNCHPTKHATADSLIPRGGGAFLNEIDGNLTCWLADVTVTLHWQRKLRSDEFDPIPFEIERRPVTISGQTYWTVVAARLTDEREHELHRKATEAENCLLAAMIEVPNGTFEQWRVQAGYKHRSRVQKVLERLANDRLVRRYRNRWVLTEAGETEAKRAQR